MKKIFSKLVIAFVTITLFCGSFAGCSQKGIETEISNERPIEITLNGEELIKINKGESFKEEGVILNKDAKVTKKSNLNEDVPGVYEIIYTAETEKGEKASVKRTIEVIGKEDEEKIIYLTFDDGPSEYTGYLLDVLKKNNVKATFFVTNKDSKYDYLLKRIVDEGHTIAIHTYSHDYAKIYTSEEAFMEDFNKMKTKIKNVTGVECKIFRFPGGSSNTVSKNYCKGIMTELTTNLTNAGYTYYDWNVDSGDASSKVLSKEQIKQNVINSLSEKTPNVVLQHDIKENSVDAVDSIIKEAKSMGYTFSKITDNTKECKHSVAN